MADKDITLRIRAKDTSKQTFDQLTKTMAKLAQAMEEQRDAAKKGDASVRDLESSYSDLEKVAKAMLRQVADVKSFENQARALDETRKRALLAAQAQTAYAAKLAQQDKVLKKEEAELKRLTAARDREDRAVQKQTDTLTRLGQRLAGYGIAANQTSQATKRIEAAMNTLNGELAKQDAAIENNALHMKQLKAAQDAAAAQALADNLKRQQEALRQLAAEQRAAANGWASTAASMRATGTAAASLSQQIRNIVDPTRNGAKTLDALNESVARVQAGLVRSKKPITDFAGKIRELKNARETVTALAQMVDQFRTQTAELARLRTAYTAARADVIRLTQALTQNGADTAAISQKLRQAQQALAQLSGEFKRTSQSAREIQQQLRAAGIDTRNLTEAEQRLIAAARNTTTAQNQLTEAYRRNGAAADEAGKRTQGNYDQQKTALSWAQRLRGELLSLAAAYGGVFGAINLANSAVDAAITRQQTMSAIAVVVGKDVNAQAKEWNYVNQVADYFGANLESMAKSYGKFSAAAKGSGLGQAESKELFENVTSIGTAYGKTADQMNLVFLAIEQMLSKGNISAEEFKQQFGEQIPGAFAAGAKALGLTEIEFRKYMESASLGSDAVISIMRDLAKETKDATEQMRTGIVAQQNALDNAKFRFNLALADSGFLEAYRKLITSLTQLLESNEGKQLAEDLGNAFSSVASAAQFLVENLDLVKWAIANIAFVKGAQMAFSFGQSLKEIAGIATGANTAMRNFQAFLLIFARGLGTATVATRGLSIAMKLLARSIPILGAILIALDIGKVLYDQSETVRSIVDAMIKYVVVSFQYVKGVISGEYKEFDKLKAEYEAKNAPIPTNVKAQADQLKKDMEAVSGFRRSETETAFSKAAADEKNFNKKLDTLRDNLAKQSISQQKRVAKDDLNTRIGLVRQSYAAQLKEAEKYGGETLKRTKALIEQAVANEREAYKADHAGRGAGAANKRANLVQSTMTDLEQAESRGQKKAVYGDPTSSYGEREAAAVKAANDQYKDLENRIKKIAEFDKTGAAAMQKRLDILKETTSEAVRQQTANQELSRLQEKINANQKERKDNEALINAQADAGLISESEQVEKLNALYDQSKEKMLANIAVLREFAIAHQSAMDPDAFNALMVNLDTMKVKVENTQMAVEKFYVQLTGGLMNGLDTAFDSIVENLTAVYQGTEDWGDAVENLGVTMGLFFADLMKELAMAILKTMILRALQSFAGGGGVMGSIGTAAGSLLGGQNHTGGIAGGGGGHKRALPAGAFAAAPRYHTGGIAGNAPNSGLRPNEVPSVLEKGEEVLTRDDPRHILNGGGNQGPSSIRLIAVDDQRAATAEALKTPEGQQAMIVAMRQQLPTIKKMVK